MLQARQAEIRRARDASRALSAQGWRRSGDALMRELSFRDFPAALEFVETIGREAVDYQRRPDLAISNFNRVRLTIANPHHAGVTAAELRLAARVDAVIAAHGFADQSWRASART
jgi:pterin-4a-carbinolamine dehydratase